MKRNKLKFSEWQCVMPVEIKTEQQFFSSPLLLTTQEEPRIFATVRPKATTVIRILIFILQVYSRTKVLSKLLQ